MATFSIIAANAAFCIYYMTILLYAVKIVEVTFSNSSRSWMFCKRLWNALSWSVCWKRRDFDAFEAKVLSVLAERRLARCLVAYRTAGVVVLTFFVLWSFLAESEFPYYSDVGAADRQMLYGTHVEALPVVILGVMSQFCPEKVNTCVLDVVHLIVAAKLCVHQVGTRNKAMLLFENTSMYTMRLFFAVTLGNSTFTMFLNAATSVASVIGYWIAETSDDLEDFLIPDHKQSFIWREVYACVAIWMIARFVEAWTIADVRSSLKLTASTQAVTTIRTILSATCDAVLYLSSSLRFVAPSPQLATILLRCGGENALLETCLTDLVFSSEDERLLIQHMPPSDAPVRAQGDKLAPMVQLALKDSTGARVLCELFYASSTSIDDQTYYVVGVSELGEGREMPPAALGSSFAWIERRARFGAGASRSRSRSRSSRSSSSKSSGSYVTVPQEGDAEFAITIDTMSEELDITSCTEAFIQLGGPSSSGSPLLRWVKRKDQAKFAKSIHEFVESPRRAGRESGKVLGTFDAELRPPGLKGLKYFMNCVVFEGPDEDSLSIQFREVKNRATRRQQEMAPTRSSNSRVTL
eukprot:TRINITY_DN6707_c0_g1_i4.p1 TRINITY_DN6707_c0_g1~~TRINITY_DN6707_c0_g1_i4.p1  ORF type:complete len:581 (+),score=68.77 TRINITY_DN6707_c0_g1_i4:143-1885(+)